MIYNSPLQIKAWRGDGASQRAPSYLMGRTDSGVLASRRALCFPRNSTFSEDEVQSHRQMLADFPALLLVGRVQEVSVSGLCVQGH